MGGEDSKFAFVEPQSGKHYELNLCRQVIFIGITPRIQQKRFRRQNSGYSFRIRDELALIFDPSYGNSFETLTAFWNTFSTVGEPSMETLLVRAKDRYGGRTIHFPKRTNEIPSFINDISEDLGMELLGVFEDEILKL